MLLDLGKYSYIPARDFEYLPNACRKILVPSVVPLGGYGTIKKGILLGSLGSLRLGPWEGGDAGCTASLLSPFASWSQGQTHLFYCILQQSCAASAKAVETIDWHLETESQNNAFPFISELEGDSLSSCWNTDRCDRDTTWPIKCGCKFL